MAKHTKLNLNVFFKDLDKKETDLNIGKTVAQLIAFDNKGDDPLKIFGWAEALHEGEELSLDESDVKKFKSLIDGLSDKMALALRAQLLRIIDTAPTSEQ